MMMKFIRYDYLERGVAYVLLAGMLAVIALTIVHVAAGLWSVWTGSLIDMDYSDFQGLFERILAALIALELAHSVRQTASGDHGLIQVRTVLLIGVLAVVRKLILLEVESTSGLFLLGLAAAVLALGGVYALILWMETQTKTASAPAPGARG
jgi:uncharacterized membrane protein (DUF373 family)